MKGHLLLEGGAEFGGRMADPDRRAVALAGGRDAPLCLIPTAAAPDHNDQHAGYTGERWFRNLGVKHITVLPLVDADSANDPSLAVVILKAQFVYLLGGFPRYLGETLAGSLCGQAILEAHQSGVLVGGSSAGAMVLCEHFYDPETGSISQGLNFIPGACIIPHHNTFGRRWALRLAELLPEDILIGIDEQTGLLNDGPEGGWNVYGKGVVTLYRQGEAAVFHPGELLHALVV
ncbi:MAG TPA: Type 1 glutamine amidotransferase-like domain-containing protein [Anaerolineaceae bacterium]